MDGYDWVNWIDEYHCTDYWYEDENNFMEYEYPLIEDDTLEDE